MPHRNNHRQSNFAHRLPTVVGGISLRGSLIISLELVLVIINGGAG